jgi:hypothetical protein
MCHLLPYIRKLWRGGALLHESVCRDTFSQMEVKVLFTLQPALPRQQTMRTHLLRYRPRKFVPVHVMNANGRNGGIAPSILNRGIRRGLVISFTPRPLLPPGKEPRLLIQQEVQVGPITGRDFLTRDNSFGPARNRTTIPRTSSSTVNVDRPPTLLRLPFYRPTEMPAFSTYMFMF